MELVHSSPGLAMAGDGWRTAAQRRRGAMAGDEVAPVRLHLHYLC